MAAPSTGSTNGLSVPSSLYTPKRSNAAREIPLTVNTSGALPQISSSNSTTTSTFSMAIPQSVPIPIPASAAASRRETLHGSPVLTPASPILTTSAMSSPAPSSRSLEHFSSFSGELCSGASSTGSASVLEWNEHSEDGYSVGGGSVEGDAGRIGVSVEYVGLGTRVPTGASMSVLDERILEDLSDVEVFESQEAPAELVREPRTPESYSLASARWDRHVDVLTADGVGLASARNAGSAPIFDFARSGRAPVDLSTVADASLTSTPLISPTPSTFADDETDGDRTLEVPSASAHILRLAGTDMFDAPSSRVKAVQPDLQLPFDVADHPKTEGSFEKYTDPVWYSQAIDKFMSSMAPTVTTVHYATFEDALTDHIAHPPSHSWLPTPLPSATESAVSPDSETDPDRTFEAPSASTTTLTPPSPRSPLMAAGTCTLFLSPPLSPRFQSPSHGDHVEVEDEGSLAEYFSRKAALFDGDTASSASRSPATDHSSPEVPLIDVEPPPRPTSASASSGLSYTSRTPSPPLDRSAEAEDRPKFSFIPAMFSPESISSPITKQALQSSWASWAPQARAPLPFASPSHFSRELPRLPVAAVPAPPALATNELSQTDRRPSAWIEAEWSSRSPSTASPQLLMASEYSTSTPSRRVSNNSSPATEIHGVNEDGYSIPPLQSSISGSIPVVPCYQEPARRDPYVVNVPLSEGTMESVVSESTPPASPRHVPVSTIYASNSTARDVPQADPLANQEAFYGLLPVPPQRHVAPQWSWHTPISSSDYPSRIASSHMPAVAPAHEATLAPIPPQAEASLPWTLGQSQGQVQVQNQTATPLFGTMEPVVPIPPGATSVPLAPQHSATEAVRASTTSSAHPTSWYSADGGWRAPDFRGAFIAWARDADTQEPIQMLIHPQAGQLDANTCTNPTAPNHATTPAAEPAPPPSGPALLPPAGPTTRSLPAVPRPARRLRFAPLPDGTPINDHGAGAVGSGWSGGYLYPERMSPGSTCASGGYSGPQTPVQDQLSQQQQMYAPFPQEWPFSSYGQGLAQGLQGIAQGYGQGTQAGLNGHSPHATGSASGFSSTGSSMLRTPVPLGLAPYAAMYANPYATPTPILCPNSQPTGNANTPTAPTSRSFSSGSMPIPAGPLPTTPHLVSQPPSAPAMQPRPPLPAMAPPFFVPPFAPAWIEQGWTPSPTSVPPLSTAGCCSLSQPIGPQLPPCTPYIPSSNPAPATMLSSWDKDFDWAFNGTSPAADRLPQPNGFTPEFEFGSETQANTRANSQSRYPARWNPQACGGSTSQQGLQQQQTICRPISTSHESMCGQSAPPLPPPAPQSQWQPRTQFGLGDPLATTATSSSSQYYQSVPMTQLQASGRLQHHAFWFEDGNFICNVENTHFRIHQHFLKKHSSFFRDLIFEPVNLHPGYYNTFVLSGVKKADLEKLLYIFYPTSLSTPDLRTKEDWSSVLRLALSWDMTEIKALALRHLHTLITSTVERLCLATDFPELDQDEDFQENWAVPGYMELCRRGRPLRRAEGEKLGLRAVMGVWEVQWRFHSAAGSGLPAPMGLTGYRFGTAAEGSEERLERLVREVFGLL